MMLTYTDLLLRLAALLLLVLFVSAEDYTRKDYQKELLKQIHSTSPAVPRTSTVKSKIKYLGNVLKRHVQSLRNTSGGQVELVFLVDGSTSVTAGNFANEIRFVRKLLADFTVEEDATRVSVITFSSPGRVITHVDHLTNHGPISNKCSLMSEDLPEIRYMGGGTHTWGAMLAAKQTFQKSRPGARKALFLITDGYSNGRDPRPEAAKLRQGGVELFTFGIENGNVRELYHMASEPKDEHCYILDSFSEFESLARKALHHDLSRGRYAVQPVYQCDKLCEEWAPCCDIKATCLCGTQTGKYECACQPGYYGSGIHGDCLPCPPGTYKSSSLPGDLSSCIKCPDVHHTSSAGTPSIAGCKCKQGYRKNGLYACAGETPFYRQRRSISDGPITPIMCPKLTSPENGYFVHGTCNNVMHAVCGIRCKPGFLMTGSSLRSCRSDGRWSGKETRCNVRRCRPPPTFRHGVSLCTSRDFEFNTVCRFSCEPGYRVVGSRRRRCIAIAVWSGIPPHCKAVRCRPLVEINRAKIAPASCTTAEHDYNTTTCYTTCQEGYKLLGATVQTCGPEGYWNPPTTDETKCIDNTDPVIKCPSDVTVQTRPESNMGEATWTPPNATDNSGHAPTITSIPALVPPIDLPIGATKVTYVAEDALRNKGKCSFTVTVEDHEPPRIDKCPSPPPIVVKSREAEVTWAEPVFSDNSRKPLRVSSTLRPPIALPPGTTHVTYTAFDESGNNSTCTVKIEVQELPCFKLRAPLNGQTECNDIQNGVECHIYCNEGYEFTTSQPENVTCYYEENIWRPEGHLNKDCAEWQMSNEVVQRSQLTFHADESCEDRLLLNMVESHVRWEARTLVEDTCEAGVTCSLLDVYSHCVDIDMPVNKVWTPKHLSNEIPWSPLVNQLRSPNSLDDGSGAKQRLVIGLEISGKLENVHVDAENQRALLDQMNQVLDTIREEAKAGLFDLRTADQSLVYEKLNSRPSDPEFVCSQGSVRKDRHCVNCPSGTFFNIQTEMCESCALGTFQPQEGQPACLQCPQNTSTSSNNSRSSSQCKAQCLPGTFSTDGLEPCETCAIGYFQHEYAQITCLKCPEGRTTWSRGARSLSVCGELCPEGHVSKTGLAPCFPCPRGYFQPETGRAACLQCPGGVRTMNPGSVNITACLGVENLTDWELQKIPTTELRVNECFKEPCQNGGSCTSLRTGYVCICQSGWAGINCEINLDECESSPCYNNATCWDGVNSYTCQCAKGWTGLTCLHDYNECLSSPCVNGGHCRDTFNGYTCTCTAGFSGTHCEVDVDECLQHQCQNNATCRDAINSYTCLCSPGYKGAFCHININECRSSPCKNGGMCSDLVNGYSCDCLSGYTGDNCETEIDECTSDPCINGGTCVDRVAGFRCICAPSYTGRNCQTKLLDNFDIEFTGRSTADYIIVRPLRTNLTEVALSFWMKTDDKDNYGTPLSYATKDHKNALTISNYNGFVLYVNDEDAVTDVTANDGDWHHVTVTWQSENGKWTVYLDGIIQDSGHGLAANTSIQAGGYLVLGQEQDRLGSDFSSSETFIGHLSKLHIWDHVLNSSEARSFVTTCDEYVGDVLAWPDVLAGIRGRVRRRTSAFCRYRGCLQPDKVEFGTTHLNGTSFGSRVEFSCYAGYTLVGPAHRTCQLHGKWSQRTPSCKPVNCGYPDRNPHSGVRGRSYTFGGTVEYFCDRYFNLVGSKMRKCMENGQWEGKAPTCEEIRCASLRQTPNMTIQTRLNIHRPGDTIFVWCEKGYRLTGPRAVMCQDNGEWEAPLPTCVETTCPELMNITNGYIEMNFTIAKPGDVATYSCDEGFTTRGSGKLVCRDSGTWSEGDPSCEEIRCLPLLGLNNGHVTSSNFTVNETVQFQCNLGYTLIGESVLLCTGSGVWNSSQPVCMGIPCPIPTVLPHGLLHYRGNRVGDLLNYTCESGYTLTGLSVRDCLNNGTWSGKEPECLPITCEKPVPDSHTFIQGESFIYQSLITVGCETGYMLKGSLTSMCSENGEWRPELARCEIVYCPPPSPLHKGSVIGTNFSFSATIYYTCDVGFSLIGANESVCGPTGMWNNDPPQCQVVTCPEPPQIENGLFFADNLYYNSVLTYRCDIGYEISDDKTRTCLANGTWNSTFPVCMPVTCPIPEAPSNGYINKTGVYYRNIITYGCEQDYQLTGSKTRMCTHDRRWTGDPPECEFKKCPQPNAIPYGSYTGNRTIRSSIYYSCNIGYILQGTQQRICLPGGMWSDTDPECTVVTCPEPSIVENASIMFFNLTYNCEAVYTCNDGYKMNGSAITVCQADGNWSRDTPSCIRVSCPKPPFLDHGQTIGHDYSYGESIENQCQVGYKLIGPTVRSCLSSSQWNGTDPYCQEITCPDPETIENGYVNVTGMEFNEAVFYTCEAGFVLEGSDTRRCQENQTWTEHTPTCRRLRCGEPPAISHASPMEQEYFFGDKVEYICDIGYKLDENLKLVCHSNGIYIGNLPVCKPVVCGEPDQIDNGSFFVNSSHYGDIIQYTCKTGYEMSDSGIRYCLSNGTWEGSLPVCTPVHCSPPPRIGNATLTFVKADAVVGDSVFVECDEGFDLKGSTFITCLNDSNWSKDAHCDPVRCQALLVPNGKIDREPIDGTPYILDVYTFNDNVTIKCDTGFKSTVTSITCTKDGVWSAIPICSRTTCKPPNITNAHQDEKATYYFAQNLLITCGQNYKLMGDANITCGKDGEWLPSIPSCRPSTCDVPEIADESGIIIHPQMKEFTVGMAVTFKCQDDHQLVGTNQSTCLSDNNWNTPVPQCKRMECTIPDIPDAKISVGSINYTESRSFVYYGEAIHIDCLQGYELDGESDVVCSAGGQWQTSLPLCKAVYCASLSLPNGVVYFSSRFKIFGSKAMFRCNFGYKLIGNDSARCQDSREWSSDTPLCIENKCPGQELYNTIVTVGVTTMYSLPLSHVGTVVNIECEDGFRLPGSGIIECLPDGRWSAPIPVCQTVTCRAPTDKQRLNTSYLYRVGEVIAYRCPAGQKLVGEPKILCLETGTWSSSPPDCIRTTCPLPEIKNGNISNLKEGNAYFGTKAEVHCNKGHILNGNSSIVCSENGLWSNSNIHCVLIECQAPAIPHGYIMGNLKAFSKETVTNTTVFKYGDIISISCGVGYELRGFKRLQCTDDGEFTTPTPICIPMTCKVPEIPNGYVQGSSIGFQDYYTYGENITFHCETGFDLVGPSSTICQAGKLRSSLLPRCISRGCLSPSEVDHATTHINSTLPNVTGVHRFGTKLTYSCETGYELVGDETLVCSQRGDWIGTIPYCKRMECAIKVLDNGVILNRTEKVNYTYGELIQLRCNPGYLLQGDYELRCGANKSWLGHWPVCQKKPCLLPDIPNGFPFRGIFTFGDTLRYECLPGFELIGPKDATCNKDGIFDQKPRCVAITCEAPKPLENGILLYNRSVVNSTLEYRCHDGFILIGANSSTCLMNRTWSGLLPVCNKMPCDPLPNVNNAYALTSLHKYGDSAEYMCQSGFYMTRNVSLQCSLNGTWTGILPICSRVDCGHPPVFDYTIIVLNGTEFGDQFEYTCVRGYEMKDAYKWTCRANGTWDDRVPECRRVKCPDPGQVKFGSVLGQNFLFESEILYKCDEGYELHGPSSRICSSNKTWTGENPVCTIIKCDEPSPVGYGKVMYNDTVFKSIVNYICDVGYILEGPNSGICLANRTWSVDLPRCVKIKCTPLTPPDGGLIVGKSFTFGSQVSYSCRKGYTLIGDSIRLCSSKGTWSGIEPECRKVNCGEPARINNTTMYWHETYYNSTVLYKCNDGFRTMIPILSVCLETGNWSRPLSLCKAVSCQYPERLMNGYTDFSSNLYGSVVAFSCGKGYKLVGSKTIECTANATWNATQPICQVMSCENLTSPDNGFVHFTNTTFMSTARYSCAFGFVLVGNAIRVCSADGKWTHKPPFCEKVNCWPAPSISHGIINSTGHYINDSITFVCDRGYELIGAAAVTCLETGFWSTPTPQCEPIVCNHPNLIPNTFVDWTKLTYGSNVSYVCNSGFELTKGDQLRLCQANKTWSGMEPVCERIKCPYPPKVANAKELVSSAEYGAVVSYECLPGYRLFGNKNVVCLSNKTWSLPIPYCQIIHCSQPALTSILQINGSAPYTFGSDITYFCIEGYILSGDTHHQTCQANGTWSGNVPFCKRIACDQPPQIEHGELIPVNVTFGTIPNYECEPGYDLHYRSNFYCNESGLWTGDAPLCKEIKCVVPPVPPHAVQVNVSSTYLGEVFYDCDFGYEHVGGNRTRQCKANRQWGGLPPKCVPRPCTVRFRVKYGFFVPSSGSYGDYITFHCNNGYRPVGTNKQLCQADGRWSGGSFTCQPIVCDALVTIKNIQLTVDTLKYGGVASYACNEGFEPSSGDFIRKCTVNGTWSGDPPSCQRIQCPYPESPLNGYIEGNNFRFGDEIRIRCHTGFILRGPDSRTCQADSAWSDVQSACLNITCASPDDPSKGHVEIHGINYESVAVYICNKGYRPLGETKRFCVGNNIWNGTEPKCVKVSCGLPSELIRGFYQIEGVMYHDRILGFCEKGFSLKGPMERVCLENGTWSGQDPLCIPVKCSRPEPIKHGTVSGQNYTYGAAVVYQCVKGYIPRVPVQKMCLPNGTWEGKPPECTQVECPIPRNIANGLTTYSKSAFNGVVQYKCNKGFNLLGERSSLCTEFGNWSFSAPECQIVSCQPLKNITNGKVQFRSFIYGSIAMYTCMHGYNIKGTRTRQCTPSGKWTEKTPACIPINCGPPPLIQFAQHIGENYNFDAEVWYKCDTGYTLTKNVSRRCQSSGLWTFSGSQCKLIECGPPDYIPYGSVIFSSTTYLSSATYSCSVGYTLTGDDARYCTLDGAWNGTSPVCEKVKCCALSNISNGIIQKDSFEYESIVMYTCDKGYSLSGVRKRTCLANGTWSGSAPSCRIIMCPRPYLANGIPLSENRTFGSTVTFTCKSGFKMVGNATHQCQASGDWLALEAKCIQVTCTLELAILNGRVSVGDGKFGSVVRYICNPGYILIGSPKRQCLSSGIWSGRKPTCQVISCPKPFEIPHAIIVGKIFIYKSIIRYKCWKGYTLKGPAERTCKSSGTWNDNVPRCVPVSCGKPPEFPYGKTMGDAYNVGNMVMSSCNPGYKLTGVYFHRCLADGTWSDFPPSCHSQECPHPGIPEKGLLHGANFSYGATVTYSCQKGFQLTGPSKQRCLDNSTWSERRPECHKVHCPMLSHIPHGYVVAIDNNYGAVADYFCHHGFILSGNTKRICQENGTWTDYKPTCKPVICGNPENVAHSFIIGSNRTFGATIMYQCVKGFLLQGHKNRTCEGDGSWTGSSPVCLVRLCERPIEPPNGKAHYSNRTKDALLSFSCDKGYRLSGNSVLRCERGEVWNASFPICQKISCGVPPFLNNTLFVTESFSYGDIFTYTCKEGTIPIGNPSITCQNDGEWSQVAGKCQPVLCPSPPDVPNALPHISGRSHLDILVYSCSKGYIMKGSNLLECDSSGNWVGETPKCDLVHCGLPQKIIPHATVHISTDTLKSVAIYQCNEGYVLEGTNRIECSVNGTWLGKKQPSCKPIECGDPPRLINAKPIYNRTTLLSKAIYDCDRGFVSQELNEVLCLSNGRWEGELSDCLPVACTVPAAPDHGDASWSSTTYNSSVMYSCERGFVLTGSSTAWCQHDGYWSTNIPTCNAVNCEQPPDPVNGRVVSGVYLYNDTLVIICDAGYNLESGPAVVCLENGSWSSGSPSCLQIIKSPCPPPRLTSHAIIYPPKETYSAGDTFNVTCLQGYRATSPMTVTCRENQTWSSPGGTCQRVNCGKPKTSDRHVIFFGSSRAVGEHVVYRCLGGRRPAGRPVLRCLPNGEWDSVASCSSRARKHSYKCAVPCQNGGTCIGANRCRCANGYTGRFCQKGVCILPCLNGGTCIGPYRCFCRHGYTGFRCQKPLCNTPCMNGGRCYAPDRCACRYGYTGPFCDRKTYLR